MRTLEDLGWPTLVEHWVKRCATFRGAAHVRREALLDDLEAARARVAQISEARDLAARDARLPLGGISEISEGIARVRKAAALDATELVAVATTARAFAKLRTHLREHAGIAPRLAKIGEGLADLGHVFHPILDAFDREGRLVDHASDALGGLRRAHAAIRAELDRRMGTLLTDERFAPYLQDGYFTQREDRYVLPVRTDGKGFVRGIVHGTSQSGQTLFIEPDEIVDLNNRAKLAECDVADEERRILAKFSGWVAEEADAFDASTVAAEHLDVVAAAAIMADDTVSAAPIIDASPRVALLHARHPLMLLAERRCVANDVTIDAGQTLLVSGPNAGGKTVALKTVGLAALMARAGLHLTAESGSVIGWFTDVRTDIGDAQSLERDLSTFSGHMVNLRELLATAGPGSLVLIDEIAVGTDPDQGAALAQAVLEGLAARGATTIVTTHYERLKVLGADDARFANASVGFDLARLEPTFKLHLGAPGSSGAFAVAQRMGISTTVVQRARELLGTQAVRIEDMLASLADQRRRIEEERAALLAEIEAMEADRAASRLERERSRMRLEKEQRTVHGEALVALKAARREIDEVRREVRAKAQLQQATADDVREAARRLAPVGAIVARHEPRRAQLPGTPARIEQLVQGAPVIVPRLGRAEVVAVAPDGKVEVRVGSMRALVPIADVLIDSHRSQRKADRLDTARGTGVAELDAKPQGPSVVLVDGVPAGGKVTARTLDSTIDVRGQRADEAIGVVDQFIDESVMAARDAVFVVHGHGTGALRTAIREHLKKHVSVARFRAGESNEGGDGLTVAFLK
ncbi:MAG: Smr/MutS family protein [Proteobacteria bacterium]|nr:Smr/MutS family protein [Pseudomonadota bacterium]